MCMRICILILTVQQSITMNELGVRYKLWVAEVLNQPILGSPAKIQTDKATSTSKFDFDHNESA